MRSCELLIQRPESLNLTNAKVMPTVCLLALPLQPSRIELEKLVYACLSVGTIFFAVWGDCSDNIEDEIDFILEGVGDRPVCVPTTAHSNESTEDTANFAVNAAYLENEHFRVLAVVGDCGNDGESLVASLKRLCHAEESAR